MKSKSEEIEILKQLEDLKKKYPRLKHEEELPLIIAFQDPKAELVNRYMAKFPLIKEKVVVKELTFLNLSSQNEKLLKSFLSRDEIKLVEEFENTAFINLLCKNSPDFNLKAKRAMDKLILSNLGLILTYAKKAKGGTLDAYDLFVEGMLGLIHAVDKFDRTRKGKDGPLKFSTYATWWIRQYIQRAIQDKGRTIRIPIHVHDLINKLRKVYYELASLNFDESPPDSKQLSAAAQLKYPDSKFDQKTVERLGSYLHEINSIDEFTNEDENLTIEQSLPADSFSQPENTIEDNINRQKLLELLEKLNEKECKFMKLLYGFSPDRIERSPKEIASAMGIKQKEVLKIERVALAKLREMACKEEFSI